MINFWFYIISVFITIIIILLYFIFKRKNSYEWQNGKLAKIKVILDKSNKCLGNFTYYKDDKNHIGKILTGINMPLVDCSEGLIFRKLGNKLNLVYPEDDEKLNECLVYNKPNIIGWRQCDEESVCETQKEIYDTGKNNIAYMDCMNFEFIKDKLTKMYKIKIIGKDNKCFKYLGNNNWGEINCDNKPTLFDVINV
jgi:hypothetical protein